MQFHTSVFKGTRAARLTLKTISKKNSKTHTLRNITTCSLLLSDRHLPIIDWLITIYNINLNPFIRLHKYNKLS